MFYIDDGRECFYQWDLDRRIVVEDPSIKEVHFCNRTDECSLVVETYLADKLYANVPNILLQQSFDVRVFGYDGKATLHEKTFKVKPRTKPSDYVYTEIDIRNYEELSKRINKLEEPVYELVLPNEGELITDERTVELLANARYGIFPMCSYRSVLISDNRANLGGVSSLVFVRPSAVTSIDYYTEYRVSYTYDSDLGGYKLIDVYEFRRSHVTKTSQLENDSDFATQAYVDDAIADITITGGGSVDLSGYYTKEETEALIEAIEHPTTDLTGYATEDYVTTAISTAFAGIATAEGGSY